MFNRIFGSLMAFAVIATFGASAKAADEGTVSAPLPRSMAAPVRIIPVYGASSFDNTNDVRTNRFDQGFTAGLLADFGSGFFTFETGVEALQTRGVAANNNASVNVQSWGLPLAAKLNLSGKPHETVFLKAGVMPFNTSGDINAFNVMGVGGIGGHIPLGRNSSLMLDADYNRMFTRNGGLTDYQGITLLGGLAFNI